MAHKNKVKGNTFELKVRKDLLKWYPLCQTSRLVSRGLDNSGVDLANIPFLIQCKAGYETTNFNHTKEEMRVREDLKKHFLTDNPVHGYPYIIIHRKTPRKPPIVHLDYDLFIRLSNKIKPAVQIDYDLFMKMLEAVNDNTTE